MAEHPPSDAVLLGVMDGHGQDGHEVSSLLAEMLPDFVFQHEVFLDAVEAFSRAAPCPIDEGLPLQGTRDASSLPPSYAAVCHALSGVLAEAIEVAEQQLMQHTDLALDVSGSTLVLAVVLQDLVVVANVGDSRCSVVSGAKGGEGGPGAPLAVTHVTQDHKPNLPSETKRILLSGGCVRAITYEDGVDGPVRVWANSTADLPGLAMSRSVCDLLGKTCGVVSTPDFFFLRLRGPIRALLLASDGLWEFMGAAAVGGILGKTRKAALVQVADDAGAAAGGGKGGADAGASAPNAALLAALAAPGALLAGDLAAAAGGDVLLLQQLQQLVDETHLQLAIDALANEAVQRWVQEEGVIDDVSIVLAVVGQ